MQKYPAIPFKMCRRFPVVTVLAMTNGKAQSQTPQSVVTCGMFLIFCI
jgi:hypothetical protein